MTCENEVIGVEIKVNRIGHPFYNKRGIVIGISPMDENRMLCRFPRNRFTFGFDKKDLAKQSTSKKRNGE